MPERRPYARWCKTFLFRPGFDLSKLEASGLPASRYHLAAAVTGAITCEWLERWTEAKATGDKATVAEASAALATAHDWQILHEINAEGDWPHAVYEFADAVKTGEIVGNPGGSSRTGTISLSHFPVRYNAALGCRVR